MNLRHRIAVTTTVLLAVCLSAPAAHADEAEPHPEIAYALSVLPGGHAVGATRAVWPDLDITFEVGSLSTRAVGSCSTGSICAYRNSDLTGAKITFGGCSTYSTVAFGAVGSIANARSSGWADARNGAGALLKRVVYNSWSAVPGGTTTITCRTGAVYDAVAPS